MNKYLKSKKLIINLYLTNKLLFNKYLLLVVSVL